MADGSPNVIGKKPDTLNISQFAMNVDIHGHKMLFSLHYSPGGDVKSCSQHETRNKQSYYFIQQCNIYNLKSEITNSRNRLFLRLSWLLHRSRVSLPFMEPENSSPFLRKRSIRFISCPMNRVPVR
jgi:hypothetical protein